MERTMDDRKEKIYAAVQKYGRELIAFGEDILQHPELGYREQRTQGKIMDAFMQMGLRDIAVCGLTGVKGWLPGPRNPQLPRIAILGEMDAVVSPLHPLADPLTGAAHACGHHAGLTAMLGAGMAILEAAPELAGSICLMAVPAEEYVEIAYRKELAASGRIKFLGGKQQLISEGCFDDVDVAMMVHALTDCPGPRVCVSSTAGGFIGKSVRFIGREAHAGGAPHLGVNALNAAAAAIMCIHARRETFRDEDHVRVHPIITKGGDIVNTVPADVRMESYVRAATTDAMADAGQKVDCAIRGAAYAVGAEVIIENLPGYLPLKESLPLSRLFAENASILFPDMEICGNQPFCGSTDMGDLSHMIPVIQPTISGFAGALHSSEFHVTDPELAYLAPAVLMAATAGDLLTDGGMLWKEIREGMPRKKRAEYEAMWEALVGTWEGL